MAPSAEKNSATVPQATTTFKQPISLYLPCSPILAGLYRASPLPAKFVYSEPPALPMKSIDQGFLGGDIPCFVVLKTPNSIRQP